MEYVTSWEDRGIAIGSEKGRVEALREMLLDVPATRIGAVDAGVVTRVEQMHSAADLKDPAHLALTAGSAEEVGSGAPRV